MLYIKNKENSWAASNSFEKKQVDVKMRDSFILLFYVALMLVPCRMYGKKTGSSFK